MPINNHQCVVKKPLTFPPSGLFRARWAFNDLAPTSEVSDAISSQKSFLPEFGLELPFFFPLSNTNTRVLVLVLIFVLEIWLSHTPSKFTPQARREGGLSPPGTKRLGLGGDFLFTLLVASICTTFPPQTLQALNPLHPVLVVNFSPASPFSLFSSPAGLTLTLSDFFPFL